MYFIFILSSILFVRASAMLFLFSCIFSLTLCQQQLVAYGFTNTSQAAYRLRPSDFDRFINFASQQKNNISEQDDVLVVTSSSHYLQNDIDLDDKRAIQGIVLDTSLFADEVVRISALVQLRGVWEYCLWSSGMHFNIEWLLQDDVDVFSTSGLVSQLVYGIPRYRQLFFSDEIFNISHTLFNKFFRGSECRFGLSDPECNLYTSNYDALPLQTGSLLTDALYIDSSLTIVNDTVVTVSILIQDETNTVTYINRSVTHTNFTGNITSPMLGISCTHCSFTLSEVMMYGSTSQTFNITTDLGTVSTTLPSRLDTSDENAVTNTSFASNSTQENGLDKAKDKNPTTQQGNTTQIIIITTIVVIIIIILALFLLYLRKKRRKSQQYDDEIITQESYIEGGIYLEELDSSTYAKITNNHYPNEYVNMQLKPTIQAYNETTLIDE